MHLAYIGHPILGDAVYGTKKGLSRQALHAQIIGFRHPKNGKYMEFKSPIPPDIENLIREEVK